MTSSTASTDAGIRRQNRLRSARGFLRALFSRKITVVAAAVIAGFIFMAVFAPIVAPYDPSATDFAAYLQGPSSAHLLGTDAYGRDVLSRIIYGTQVSLIIGLFAVCVACMVGTFLGMVSGYVGGVVDDLICRLNEAINSLPQIVLAMALTAVFGVSIPNLAIILGISSMSGYVRMMRGQVLQVKNSDYVTAARLQGCSALKIMFRHILPNALSPIIVMMTQNVGGTILAEAGLSFLGLGITSPTASWGTMVSEGKDFLLQDPILALVPGLCVALLVVFLNVLGDGVRDALDPRLRGEL